jgi:hypothetical protein
MASYKAIRIRWSWRTVGVAVELAIRHFRHPEQLGSTLKFVAGFLVASSCSRSRWAAFGSDYASKDRFGRHEGDRNPAIDHRKVRIIAVFMRFIVPVIGWWWFCPIAFCLISWSSRPEGALPRQWIRHRW